MKAEIKIGYLISYDYNYLINSLESVYKYADLIVLCYDKDFKTWSGNTFEIPDTFFDSIKKFDKKNKIKLYADTFFIPENVSEPMKSDTYQRNKLGEFMGAGGWHIQLDVDEYVYDFKKMIEFLKKSEFLLENPEKNPISIIAKWVVLFKKDEDGFYIIKPINENFYFATNNPKYIRARQTNWICILTNHKIIHQSWAREKHEIKQKLDNWSHKNDFDGEKYFNFWENINNSNYQSITDFHPVEPKEWHSLEYLNFNNIKLLLRKSPKLFPQESTLNELKNIEIYIDLPRKLRKKINSKLKWQKKIGWLKIF